jgi:hypothetical protein
LWLADDQSYSSGYSGSAQNIERTMNRSTAHICAIWLQKDTNRRTTAA